MLVREADILDGLVLSMLAARGWRRPPSTAGRARGPGAGSSTEASGRKRSASAVKPRHRRRRDAAASRWRLCDGSVDAPSARALDRLGQHALDQRGTEPLPAVGSGDDNGLDETPTGGSRRPGSASPGASPSGDSASSSARCTDGWGEHLATTWPDRSPSPRARRRVGESTAKTASRSASAATRTRMLGTPKACLISWSGSQLAGLVDGGFDHRLDGLAGLGRARLASALVSEPPCGCGGGPRWRWRGPWAQRPRRHRRRRRPRRRPPPRPSGRGDPGPSGPSAPSGPCGRRWRAPAPGGLAAPRVSAAWARSSARVMPSSAVARAERSRSRSAVAASSSFWALRSAARRPSGSAPGRASRSTSSCGPVPWRAPPGVRVDPGSGATPSTSVPTPGRIGSVP